MPVYKPIKPSLPKNEFRSYNKRKIFFISISIVLIIASILLLYLAFRPYKTVTESKQEEEKQETIEEGETKEETSTKPKGQTYKVETGDTLFSIGQKFDIDWHNIADANDLKEPYTLEVGQEILIPETTEGR
jgi:LysM repeat protein